ncbi:amidohydrolase family protein [Streptacidiphilus sp. P02-A3a]|nr:amidohydrolase family protein [Streptacidiphilus sp. P02-A3a]QMU73850.1 amidohydrolase family protein [Streptacidiphilus sp. P02-A3a]
MTGRTPADAAAPLVDAHHHLWDLSVRDQDWITGPELAPLRRDFLIDEFERTARAGGVDASVLVQTVCVAAETPELLAVAAAGELVAGVVGWTDLTAPGIADTLAELRQLPGGAALVGLRHQVQGEPDPRWLLRPEVLRGLRQVAAAGLVYDLVLLPEQLPAAIEAAKALPELTFVLDHLAKPPIATGELRPWAERITALAALPNTVCKLSGLVTEADWSGCWSSADLRPYADTVLRAFGPERLMFGSDWPVCTLAADYPQVLDIARELTSALGPDERAAVFGGTAVRTYGLPDPAAR